MVRAVRSARAAEPELGEAELLELITGNTGVTAAQIDVALAYRAAHPDEIDEMIFLADEAEERAARAMGG